ncbi:DUF2493 domain-containing protein [Thermodesulfobacteriota bacterium]
MKTAVIGNRDFNDYEKLKQALSQFKISVLVSGGAKGADTLAERYADEHGIEKEIIKPDYKSFGKSAIFIRNREIVEKCERLIAFWNGKPGGTEYTIKHADKKNKEITIIRI